MKKKIKKPIMFVCNKCPKEFVTQKGAYIHERRMHYAPPAPAPKKTIETAKCTPYSGYSGSYIGARRKLDIGDVFYRIEKHVVNSLIITDNSEDLQISSTITKSWWQQNKPE